LYVERGNSAVKAAEDGKIARMRAAAPTKKTRALIVGAALSLVACRRAAQPAAALPGAPLASSPAATLLAPPEVGKRWLGVIVSREAVSVSAPISGRLLSVEASTGDTVKPGQLLARLDRTLLEQDLSMSRSSVDAAAADLRRSQEELSEARARNQRRQANPDFFSKEDLAEAALREKTALTAQEAAQAHLAEAQSRVKQLTASLGQTEIRAPFAGRIAERFLGPGTSVAPGTPIFRLLSGGAPMVRAAVPPGDAGSLKLGQPVAIQPRGDTARLKGTVSRIAPEIDAASQMILIEVELQNPPAGGVLRDGLVVDVTPA
jgi:RND family efflux transporter MFP subunit